MEDYDDGGYDGSEDYPDRQWQQEVPIVQRESFKNLFRNCIQPVVLESHLIIELLAACFLCRIVCQPRIVPIQIKTVLISAVGVVLGWRHVGAEILPIAFLVALAYPVTSLLAQRGAKMSTITVSFMCLSCYLILELFVVSAENFLKIRGCLMITTMKIISYGGDVDSGELPTIPNPLSYAGYFLSPSSLIFGPWLSFIDHCSMFETQTGWANLINIAKALLATIIGVSAMVYSSCFSGWIFLEHYPRWLLYFGVAQAFRFSHYFVSYLSEATLVMSGCRISSANGKLQDKGNSVTEISAIEFPRSLVAVVTSWNIPMHRWLRKYVFRNVYAQTRSAALAVFFTYATSSLLHGLNFQLSAVLLSLGFFTFVEHEMREKFAKAFSGCVRSRSCIPGCNHAKSKFDPVVIFLNLSFSSLAVFNLIYLGMVFDVEDQNEHVQGYSMRHTLESWKSVTFCGHILNLGLLVFAKSI